MSKSDRRRIRLRVSVVLTMLGSLTLLAPSGVAHASSSALSTYVEPAAGYGFIDQAIKAATHSIDLSMYELEDPSIEAELVARARAGVDVKVVLDTAYGISNDNEPAARILVRGGVHVTWAPTSQIFHAKYLIIDDRALYVGTGNFTAQYYSSTRDFWIIDHGRSDVVATSATFAADFAHRSAPLSSGSGELVWSPGSTSSLVGLINSAQHSLLVENEEMDSDTVESALEAAAQRGVDVEVVMTYDSSWHDALAQLTSGGVHVHVLTSNQVYIHAKVICADCSASTGTVFVGSENFSTSSLDYNRELGLITSARSVVEPVWSTVNADFRIGTSHF